MELLLEYSDLNFRALYHDIMSHVSYEDLNIGDIAYVTNGIYDQCLGKVIKKDYFYNDDDRKEYEIEVEVLIPLSKSIMKYGIKSTNMIKSSNDFEIIPRDNMCLIDMEIVGKIIR